MKQDGGSSVAVSKWVNLFVLDSKQNTVRPLLQGYKNLTSSLTFLEETNQYFQIISGNNLCEGKVNSAIFKWGFWLVSFRKIKKGDEILKYHYVDLTVWINSIQLFLHTSFAPILEIITERQDVIEILSNNSALKYRQ